MTSVERTIDFIAGKLVDVPPLHPIIMQFAAGYAGVQYRDFCLDPESKTRAMIKCADDFDLDWVTVMSDPYCEAEAYGLHVDYPQDSLPLQRGHVISDIGDVAAMHLPEIASSPRMMGRIREIEDYHRQVGDKYFVLGWVEGSIAEYVDLRGLSDTCLDLFDSPNELSSALDIIVENAMRFAKAQIDAGAHCIGIGDAACSQIGPRPYKQYAFEREKCLVDHIHSLGALAKLHICGDTTMILPDMIATGADIIDVDHLVSDMGQFVGLLGPNQVLSGNSDPVEIVMRGSKETIESSVQNCFKETAGRGIVSAGCEIPKQTSVENFTIYCRAARNLVVG
ncbi:MAG: uroporphyrinogen decarboxylase family protein [Armatimonadota bacterium]